MKRKYFVKIFFVLIFLFISNALSSQINFEWQRRYNAAIFNTEYNPNFNNIAIDSSSNVYYTVFISDTNSLRKLLLIKYNSTGDFKWSRIYKTNVSSEIGNHECYIKSDGKNSIYIASRCEDSTGSHILLLRYDTSGTLIWERKYIYSANQNEIPGRMTLDKFGSIYITGNIQSGEYRFLLLKYKENGDFGWIRTLSVFSSGNDVITDNSGNVYVAGGIYSNSSGKMFMMAAKYNSSGSQKWTHNYGINNSIPLSDDGAYAIALDDSNNVIVGGECFYNYSDWDYTTIKYRNNGDFVWVKTYEQGGEDIIWSIVTDSRCNIYVTGTNEGNSSLVKYDCAGNQTGVLIPNDYGICNIKYAGGKYLYLCGCKGYDSLSRAGLFFAKMDSGLNIVNSIDFLIDSSKYVWPNAIINDKNGNIFLGGNIGYENKYPPYDNFSYPVVIKLSQVTGISNQNLIIPQNYQLYQNYPNPFNPTTKIKFDIPTSLSFPHAPSGNPLISLKIYDILGREIQTLVNESLQPGSYEVTFDGSNLPSGIYFYRLETNNFVQTKKMLMIK